MKNRAMRGTHLADLGGALVLEQDGALRVGRVLLAHGVHRVGPTGQPQQRVHKLRGGALLRQRQ